MATESTLPLGDLKYLHVGTSLFEEDLAYYRDVVGRRNPRVAALRVATGPLLLIADHRPAPSCLPVFGVVDLDATVARLQSRGWRADSGPFGIPDGPCYLFSDRSGNQLALFGNVRPDALSAVRRR
jgi:hypothetical protein